MTSEKIRQRFNNDLSIIIREIKKALNEDPEAIILCGGYGRDEGAWFEDENGNPIPYNDYDIVVVTEYPLSSETNNMLRKQLAYNIGINWVDLDYYSHDRLKKLVPTIHNVDFVSVSSIIYGNLHVLDQCPKLDPAQIGHYDLELINKIRIWTFLGSWQGEMHDMSIEESRFFLNQMAKAVLACCDLLLVSKGKYTPFYRDRVEVVCRDFSNLSVLCEYAGWALQEKLKPSSREISKEDALLLYSKVRDLFIKSRDISFGCFSFFLNNPNWTKLYFFLRPRFIKNYYFNLIRNKSVVIRKEVEIFCAQNYVFMAWNAPNYNQKYIRKASNILLKWHYIDTPCNDWNILHNIVADARNNI